MINGVSTNWIHELSADHHLFVGSEADPEMDVLGIPFDTAMAQAQISGEELVRMIIAGKIYATILHRPDKTEVFIDESDLFDFVCEAGNE